MTARTSKRLATVLRVAGLEKLAQRAEADEFHDYLSPHAAPGMELDLELANIMNDPSRSLRSRAAAKAIREQHHAGKFDADARESEEWARSQDGQDAMRRLSEDRKDDDK